MLPAELPPPLERPPPPELPPPELPPLEPPELPPVLVTGVTTGALGAVDVPPPDDPGDPTPT